MATKKVKELEEKLAIATEFLDNIVGMENLSKMEETKFWTKQKKQTLIDIIVADTLEAQAVLKKIRGIK
jgi:hypothetical protein